MYSVHLLNFSSAENQIFLSAKIIVGIEIKSNYKIFGSCYNYFGVKKANRPL